MGCTTWPTLARTGGGRSCDGAVMYGDAVILFEVKGRIVPLGARSGSDLDAFENMLRSSYAEAVAQIRTTVGRIEAGAYRDVGLDPRTIAGTTRSSSRSTSSWIR